jgi:hypothetical protein
MLAPRAGVAWIHEPQTIAICGPLWPRNRKTHNQVQSQEAREEAISYDTRVIQSQEFPDSDPPC